MQKATSQGQLLKVQQRERENSLKGHYKSNQSFFEKKPLHGKQVDKQQVDKQKAAKC